MANSKPPSIDPILGSFTREFTVDDLIFNGTTADKNRDDSLRRLPNVYLREADDDRKNLICVLPKPFCYDETAFLNSEIHSWGPPGGRKPPREIGIILRALRAGYTAGFSAGRQQIVDLVGAFIPIQPPAEKGGVTISVHHPTEGRCLRPRVSRVPNIGETIKIGPDSGYWGKVIGISWRDGGEATIMIEPEVAAKG